ncbi:MAG: hypothetical protein ACR2RF_10870 [Geminicoccaceae bacterium]
MYQVGDIIFSEEWATTLHPVIVCESGHVKGKLVMAHMAETGPEVVKIEAAPPTTVWRCKNEELAKTAAAYAKFWCRDGEQLALSPDTAVNGAPATPYAEKGTQGRYYGWQAARRSGSKPSFNHDSLYRAFKWAGRMHETASRNKGMTCDVFVIACFHAAAVNLMYLGDLGKIQAKAKILGNGRRETKHGKEGRKDTFRSPKSRISVEKSVLREFSNVGAIGDQNADINIHWRSAFNDTCGPLPAELSDVFTEGLLLDAKFCDGLKMKRSMNEDSNWWSLVGSESAASAYSKRQ